MKKTLLTVIVTLVVLMAGFLLYINSGSYDISQLTPHNSFTKWIIRKTTHNSVDRRMKDMVVPSNLNDTDLVLFGFRHYNEMCVCCHGAPGVKAWEMAEGLYPEPPKMYKKKKNEDPKEFFWIIKNGIKMTSMPAYGPTHDDRKILAITAFVTGKLNKMSEEEYADWIKKYAEQNEHEDIGARQ